MWQGWQRLSMKNRGLAMLLVVVILFFVLLIASNHRSVFTWIISPDTCDDWITERTLSPGQRNPEMWWDKLLRLEKDMEKTNYDCMDKRWVGNRYVCFDFNLIPEDSCLVYSFGIDYDFQFDDAMAGYGCTVYSFDPSMDVSDHKHSERVYFKQLGLSGTDADHFVPRKDGYVTTNSTWRMRRLTTIMNQLGHTQGSLTVVKIDIESYEWDVMADLLSVEGLLDALPQLLIEWHLFQDAPPRSRYDDLISIYFSFKNTGFHSFHWNLEWRDHCIKSMRTQSETSWVNERFLRSAASSSVQLGCMCLVVFICLVVLCPLIVL